MDLEKRVIRHFELSAELQRESAATLAGLIARASQLLADSLLQGGKVLSCGSGNSSGQAQHLATALLNRFERERPGLPALGIGSEGHTLTAIASDSSYKEIHAKQIKALGQANDALLIICAGRPSRSVLEAVKAAHDRDMKVVALTADDGGEIADLLQSADVELRVPAQRLSTVQETHLIIINSLCDLIDMQIFGEES